MPGQLPHLGPAIEARLAVFPIVRYQLRAILKELGQSRRRRLVGESVGRKAGDEKRIGAAIRVLQGREEIGNSPPGYARRVGFLGKAAPWPAVRGEDWIQVTEHEFA